MQLRNLVVIPIEKCKKISCKILLVGRAERADYTEIDGGITGPLRVIDLYEYVAGMHVRVKKIVPEDLCEKYLHTIFGK